MVCVTIRSDEASHGDEPITGRPQGDELVEELLRTLPDLVSDIMAKDSEIHAVMDKFELHPPEVSNALMSRADEVLRFTNKEIALLRDAKTSLSNNKQLLPVIGAQVHTRVNWRQRSAYARTVTGLWLMFAWLVAVWQVWPPLSTKIGGVLSALILIAGCVAVPWIALTFFVAPRGTEQRSDVAFFTVSVDLIIGYSLLVWRLWNPTSHAVGHGWAWVIWVLTGVLLVGFGALMIVGTSPGTRLWKALLGFALAVGMGLISWFVTARYLLPTWRHTVFNSHLPAAFAAAVALAASITIPFIVGGALAALRMLIRWVSRITELPQQRNWRHRDSDLRKAVSDAESHWRKAALDAIRPLMREQIQLMSVPPFSTTREVINPRGLQHMRSADDVIETQAFARLRMIINSLSGGAVGMAGPRGAGKSTLLQYYASGRLAAAGTEQLTLMENVPVRYDSRDYALYLYAALCEKVINFRRKTTNTKTSGVIRSRISWRASPRMLLVLAWIAVAYLVVVSSVGPHTDSKWLARIWWLPIAVLGLAALTAFLVRGPRIPDVFHTSMDGVHDLASLQEHAEGKLRSLRYQLSRTSGWSGSFGLPLSVRGTGSMTLGMSAQPMTYPEVVSDFRAFLERVTSILRNERDIRISPIPIVIILDELDKIASAERVQEFLNDAKALFTLDQPGCLFLVSVSEDALAQFERRGLPVRDAFDSTFDTILRVDYLNLVDAIRIVRSRVVRLSTPFICLSYCLSGGLPRELIRYTREVVNEPQRELAEVCSSIVGRELRSKASALETIVSQNVNVEPYTSDLMSFVNSQISPSVRDLLDALSRPPITPGLSEVTQDKSVVYLERLQDEALSHLYYCATLIEAFSALTEEQFTALGIEEAGSEGHNPFEILAAARRSFSVNARLAWITISRFRMHWNLTPLDPPTKGSNT